MLLTGQSVRSPDDAAILRESKDHPDRFADLFDMYHGEIHRYVASRLSARHADDVAAETFLVAFRGRVRFVGSDGVGSGGHVRAWLYGIATNLIRRHRRDEERKYRALGRAAASDGIDVYNDDERIAARVDALGVRHELGAALRSLKPGDRDVLLLIALAEFSYVEVAVALGIPEGTVASRLNRARRTVRAALGSVKQLHDQAEGS